jgi:AraC-like DNA-binding protein
VAIGLERLLREAAVHADQEDPGDGPSQDSRVPVAVHLVTGSYLTERVRPKFEAPQGFVTSFGLGGNRVPDSITVHRLSSLTDVEFWLVSGCERQRTQLSDMFSASLVLGSAEQECGRVWTRGRDEAFRSGDILLAEADEIQRITPTDRPNALFTVFWQRSALERAARECGLGGTPQWAVTRLNGDRLAAAFAALQALLDAASDPEAILQAYQAITEAVLHAANPSNAPALRRSPCHPGVRRAAKRVRASFAESLSLEDLASELRMSKCHLARCFERSLGVPPHRYRRLLRLQSAKRLLEAGLSVGEAANATGFADAPHLTRAFRDWLGVSPAAWGSAWRASDPWSPQAPRTMPPPKPD